MTVKVRKVKVYKVIGLYCNNGAMCRVKATAFILVEKDIQPFV